MPKFSQESLELLESVDPKLQTLFNEVIKHIDCKILSGKRTLEEQKKLLALGRTTTLKSYHLEGKALDVAPYPVLWPDEKGILVTEAEHRVKRFHVFAGFVLGIAQAQGLTVVWGGDFDKDWVYNDQKFIDMPHFQLME